MVLDLDEALTAILEDTRPTAGTESVDLSHALGRVVLESIETPISLPPFAASAMDGYAVRSGDLDGPPPYQLEVSATSYAGRPLDVSTPAGGCVRIFTGAPLPDDLDAVVIQENCTRTGTTVQINVEVPAGDNVRPVGHDVIAGSRILEPGRRLTPFDLGWLAACGIARIKVAARPTIGIFSTGDELVDPASSEPGTSPGPGRIFDANRLTLRLLLARLPVEVRDFGIVPDDRGRIRSVLDEADRTCDVVITSGGVSVGDADWVKEVVGELGSLTLWKLNLKPGKPLAYGRLRRAAFFGLPGNPVSTIVTALMLVMPAVEALCGSRPGKPLCVEATLRGVVRHQPGREEFQRGTLTHRDGQLEVSVTGDQSSNRLGSFARANCLIRMPKESNDLEQGSRVTVLPFQGLL